jgi:hypothetical protein
VIIIKTVSISLSLDVFQKVNRWSGDSDEQFIMGPAESSLCLHLIMKACSFQNIMSEKYSSPWTVSKLVVMLALMAIQLACYGVIVKYVIK